MTGMKRTGHIVAILATMLIMNSFGGTRSVAQRHNLVAPQSDDIWARTTSAVDLATLQAGRTVTVSTEPRDDPAILKFVAPEADTVRIEVRDHIEVRDSSWRVIGHGSGAAELEVQAEPGVYYIVVAPLPGMSGSRYVLIAHRR